MASPAQKVAIYFGLRKPDGDQGAVPDERTLLQVMLGNAIIAAIAGGISAPLGNDLVAAIAFGVLIFILFLYLDLRNRRKQREDGPPPTG